MKCGTCGYENAEDANFCALCGKNLRDGVNNNARDETVEGYSEVVKSNEWVDAAGRISKNFFNFFMDNLRSPSQFVKEVNRDHVLSGIIVIVLLSLLPPLFMYLQMVSSPINPFVRISFFNVVIRPAVILFLLFLLIIGLLLVAAKMKGGADYQTVTARFGASLVLPTAFALAGMILGILSAQLTMFFMGFAYIGILLSIYISLQSFQGDFRGRTVDDLYYFFAIILILVLVAGMIGQSVVQHIISQIMGSALL